MLGDEYSPGLEPSPGPWELLWRWHPMRLFGCDLRRRMEEDPHGLYHYWQYGRSKIVAREMLHSVYGPNEPRRANLNSAMLHYDGESI